MSKTELFIELASPDKNGVSRWVFVDEFVGKFAGLKLGNGASWCRANSTLAKKFNIEFDKNKTNNNKIDAVRLNGFNAKAVFSNLIRQDIREFYKDKNCVMLGVNGKTENTRIELDHKDGRKNNFRISDQKTQKVEDFQPLCKAANDIKRQICKRCKETNRRWSAKNIAGNPYDFYKGDEKYEGSCEGCYQFDPVAYRKTCISRIAREAGEMCSEFVAKKFFGVDET